MASLYDNSNGYLITDCLQGSDTCDEALDIAKQEAERRNEDILLDDDDGYWLIKPDGGVWTVGPEQAKAWGYDPHPAWKIEEDTE